MNNFNQIYFQYCIAVDELKKFEDSDNFYFLKGSLRFRKKNQITKGHKYQYHQCYYIRFEKVEGKWKKTEKYINKKNEAYYKEKMAKKKENRMTYKMLKKKVEKLYIQLKKHFKGNVKELESFMENQEKSDNYREDEKTIVSPLGVKVRSKNECIFEALAFAFGIKINYEPPIKLYKKVLHPDFSIFLKGKRVLLELLGMTESDSYMDDLNWKCNYYNENGYNLGNNLVCIACKDSRNIDSRKLGQVLLDLKSGIIPKNIVYI